jgi:hypothetical protein
MFVHVKNLTIVFFNNICCLEFKCTSIILTGTAHNLKYKMCEKKIFKLQRNICMSTRMHFKIIHRLEGENKIFVLLYTTNFGTTS